ncbi:hypothetical protein ACEPAI_3985 [Sanghuangporus weigelae]
MALAIETPSRIWRRIKEGEARDSEMPSLPSLPDLDVSGLSDLEPPSLAPEVDTIKATVNSSEEKAVRHPLTPAMPQSAWYPGSGKDVTPLPSGMSLYDEISDDEHEESDEIVPPHVGHREEDLGLSSSARLEDDLYASVSGLRVTKQSEQVGKQNGSVAAEMKAGLEATSHLDQAIFIDRGLVSADVSQGLESRRESGSLPNAITCREPKDIDVYKAYSSRRHMIRSPSLPPTSPASTSLPDMSDSHLHYSHTVEHRTCTQEQKSALETFHTSLISLQKCNDQEQAEESTETEHDQKIEKVAVSREPTFSSEGSEVTRGTEAHSPRVMNIPSSSATPTQTYLSHVIGHRFGQLLEENKIELDEADDLATPLPRKKSFLLSVVHSTTRPRLANPTPHPKARYDKAAAGPTPGPSRTFNTGRNKPRPSHPLSRTSTFIPVTPLNNLQSGMEIDDHLEGAASNSFVSTASSHDLTVHHRANASFDPLTGPQGVNRFNAGKLNMYLHGLNRRLQQENELLVNRIRTQQMELESVRDHAGRSELSGVMENDAEQWVAEKESLEQKIVGTERLLGIRDKELADEQALRLYDKEKWKERMSEIEDGVGQIITDLEQRVQRAEAKAALLDDVERRLQTVHSELESTKSTNQALRQRAEQAEQMLTHNDGDRGSTNDSPASGHVDIQVLKHQAQRKDDVLASLHASLADKGKEVSSLRSIIHDLESSLRIARETIETSHQDVKELRSTQKELKEELGLAETMADRLKSELTLSSNQIRDLEKELNEVRERHAEKHDALDIANERITLSCDELENARSNVQQLENALEESDKKILANNDELVELRSKLAIMEREHEKAKKINHSESNFADDSVDVASLKAELSEATKEIGRLTSLLDQNPARKALDKARESRINLLEKENQELLEQLRAARDPSYYATPHRNPSMSGLSPMHRRLINLSLRTPKTPGEPLRNASWLMSMTGEISTAQLVEEIDRLQRELDMANESIDDKLDKLEEAGLGVVGLTKALEDARRRIVDLENELQDRDLRLPERFSCPRCGEYENGKSICKSTNAALQFRLAAVTAELGSLKKQRDEELVSSSGEKAMLRDATNRLNIEIKRAKKELKAAEQRGHMAERSKSELQKELTRARKIIDDLEYYLQSERSRLRTMDLENSNALREKERILQKLHETEQRMEQARDRIFLLKEANIKLEAELKIERKTSNIEETLFGNKETIERLRHERSELSDKYYDLHQQLTEASKNANELTSKHAKLQMSYDARRHQLDRQAQEIENLRSALSSKVQILDNARWKNENAQVESTELSSLAGKLEFELKRIQHEANGFGRDLVHLRAERDQMISRHREEIELHECETNQVRAQLRNLKQQVVNRKETHDIASEIHAATECLRLRHNRECKGLFVQIRYLKAKYTREAALRDDLSYQKDYLLVLLSRYEASEKRILAVIAQVSFQRTSTPNLRPKSLRTAAYAVMFISRTRRASDTWREQRSACSSVAAALDNVRESRALRT